MTGAPVIAGGRPLRDTFLIFGSPEILDGEIEEVIDTLRSSWLGTGPKTARFEAEFAAYKQTTYALALNSCTAGLHIANLVAGFQPGDEVITCPMTFCATANAIIHSGATPVFADCDRVTLNIDPAAIEAKITPRTKGILPIHFAGRPCDMDAIMAIAERHDLIVIEDCAHAIETEYHGRKAGTLGQMATFSFYATKNVVTGEGGMIITNNQEYAERTKILALHGMTKDAWKRFGDEGYKHYQVVYPGFKYNMMDLQAAIGIHQLRRVETNWIRRQAIWQRYQQGLADLPLILPADPQPNTRHAYHLYTVLLDFDHLRVSRDHILDALMRENIGVGVHYVPLHIQPYYAQTYQLRAEDYPNAYWVGERTLSLPLSPKLSDQDIDDVICAMRRVISYFC